jgi:hypothetical protein
MPDQPRFDLSQGVAALWRGWERGLDRSSYERSKRKLNPPIARQPMLDLANRNYSPPRRSGWDEDRVAGESITEGLESGTTVQPACGDDG